MTLKTGTNEKIPEVSTMVPIPTVVPALPQVQPQKWRLVMTSLVIALLCMVALVLFMVLSPRVQYLNAGNVGFSEVEYELMAAAMDTKKNFNVRIDIDGEKYIESVHADARQNIVTFHYTGENGRDGGTAIYDFNQGLTVFKDGNATGCFFINAYDLPVVELGDLQLKARNKQVMEINQQVTTKVSGVIPEGFLQVSVGPLFGDLCRDVPSYWLVLAPRDEVEGDRMRIRRVQEDIHIRIKIGSIEIEIDIET